MRSDISIFMTKWGLSCASCLAFDNLLCCLPFDPSPYRTLTQNENSFPFKQQIYTHSSTSSLTHSLSSKKVRNEKSRLSYQSHIFHFISQYNKQKALASIFSLSPTCRSELRAGEKIRAYLHRLCSSAFYYEHTLE